MKNDVLILILWVSVQWASAQDTVYIDKNYRWYDKAGAVEYAHCFCSSVLTQQVFVK
ncbi:MAG: hypothetical protein ACLSC9_07240 [Barnesiella sp.]